MQQGLAAGYLNPEGWSFPILITRPVEQGMAVPLEREIRPPRGWVPGTGVIPGHAGLAAIQSYAEEGSAGDGFSRPLGSHVLQFSAASQ